MSGWVVSCEVVPGEAPLRFRSDRAAGLNESVIRDTPFARDLVENIGGAAVPGSCFFPDPRDGSQNNTLLFSPKI